MVLFHATAIHYHNGMDDDDTSVFLVGSELLVCLQFKFPVSHKRSGNA